MAWAKVDDQWFAHRKVVGLSLAARGLWTTVLSWSCAHRSPHVPTHMARFLTGGEDIDGPVRELVAAGLWIEQDDGWRIHDWAEYQEKSTSEKRAEAGSKGGKRSGEVRREASDEANGKQNEVASEANGEAGTHPVPARPDPKPKSGTRKRAPETPLPDSWEPTDAHAEIAKAEGVNLAREAAKFRDHAAANDRRQRDWDAAFRTWLRRANDFGGGQARASPEAKARREPEFGSPEWEARQRELEDRAEALIGGGS